MGSNDDNEALSYGLCVCTGAAIMFNIALLVWHNLKVKVNTDGRYLKHAFSCTTAVYVLLGISIVLLALHNDTTSLDLCKAGGFLSLFASQACFWFIALSCVILLLWIRMTSSGSSDTFTSHKWSLPIFVLVIIVLSILLVIFSILPMTNEGYYGDDLEENLYLCVPIQVPKKSGWGSSFLVIFCDWIAILISIVTCVLCVIRIQTFSSMQADTTITNVTSLKLYRKGLLMKWIMLITYGFNTILWTLVLTIMSITYFTSGSALSTPNTRWGLGYMIGIILMVHPILVIVLHILFKREWFDLTSGPEDASALMAKCPKQLDGMQKLAPIWQRKDVSQYLVQWRDTGGSNPQTGVMKVYHPSAAAKYHSEVRALAKMSNTHAHHNIALYHWHCSHNPFASAVADLTGDNLSVEGGLICKAYYAGGTLHQFLKSRVHQLNDIGIHKLTQDIANGLEFIHELNIVHNGLNTQCVYMSSISENVGFIAVIGDFENSFEVPSTHRDNKRPQLYTIGYEKDLQSKQHNLKFAPDIRAFGVLVLEMLVSVSEHNYRKATRTRKRSGTSSVCSAENRATQRMRKQSRESHHSVDAITPETSQNAMQSSRMPKTSQIVPEIPSNKIKSAKNHHNREKDVPKYENMTALDHIQRRELPPIPIEKVVDDVVSCASGSTNHEVSQEKPQIHSETASAFKPKQNFLRSQAIQNSNDAVDSAVKEKVTISTKIYQQNHPGIISPKPRIAPKPNLLRSIQQGIILSESGESDTDTLTTKRTPGINATSPISHPTKARSPLSGSDHEDVYNQSVTSVGSFDTIYEDDESQGDSLTRSLDSGLGKSQNFERQAVVKRKTTAVVKQEMVDATNKKKRISTSSLTNESVLSGDSGVGSSHYTSSNYGPHSDVGSVAGADTASVAGSNHLNAPGSRDTIYEIESSSCVSDPDSFSLLSHFLKTSNQKLKIDSGIESAMDSCDENPVTSRSVGIHKSSSKSRVSKQGRTLVATEIHVDIEQEKVLFPDLVVRKKPCTGQHRHLKGMTCCANNTTQGNSDTKEDTKVEQHAATATKKHYRKNSSLLSHPRGNVVIDTQDINKMLVDEGTMTTDSLERKKVTSESIQTDTESYISGLSVTTVKSESCHCSGATSTVECDIQSFHSAGHNIPRQQTHSHKTRQPRLGVTAVNFSRIAQSSSNRSTPLTNSVGPTGSTQSLVNGRTSVASGRQSINSLPGGPNSISNSVLSLLQDSNLFGSSENQVSSSSSSGVKRHLGKSLSRPRHTSGEAMAAHHPVVQHILKMPDVQDTVLEALQTRGFLGHTSAKLVPLLKDCWLKEEVVSTDEILQRLHQVLPSATV